MSKNEQIFHMLYGKDVKWENEIENKSFRLKKKKANLKSHLKCSWNSKVQEKCFLEKDHAHIKKNVHQNKLAF